MLACASTNRWRNWWRANCWCVVRASFAITSLTFESIAISVFCNIISTSYLPCLLPQYEHPPFLRLVIFTPIWFHSLLPRLVHVAHVRECPGPWTPFIPSAMVNLPSLLEHCARGSVGISGSRTTRLYDKTEGQSWVLFLMS